MFYDNDVDAFRDLPMSAALMEPLGSARSASVGRRTSVGPANGMAPAQVADEIIEDRRKHADGSVQVRKYLKGRFLGKVRRRRVAF
jgi:hypothetical protein